MAHTSANRSVFISVASLVCCADSKNLWVMLPSWVLTDIYRPTSFKVPSSINYAFNVKFYVCCNLDNEIDTGGRGVASRT